MRLTVLRHQEDRDAQDQVGIGQVVVQGDGKITDLLGAAALRCKEAGDPLDHPGDAAGLPLARRDRGVERILQRAQRLHALHGASERQLRDDRPSGLFFFL